MSDMAKVKIAVTVEASLVRRLDALVSRRQFPSRSAAVERAIAQTLRRQRQRVLARELARLNPAEEQAWAELGLGADTAQWPRY